MSQIDPVCGMTVEAESATRTYALSGRTYFFCSERCLNAFTENPESYTGDATDAASRKHHDVARAPHHWPEQAAPTKSAKELAKDPICGMLVKKTTALRTERSGQTYYFCSVNCQRTFESPEAELTSMRTRVAIALTGVLALAILRASAFIALAAGATLLTWAPIAQLPCSRGASGCSCS